VCARVTREFLDFSTRRGNDLVTARPEFGFPGLKPGDRWCLCAMRWLEALAEGVAPPVVLESTHERALAVVTLEQLKASSLAHRVERIPGQRAPPLPIQPPPNSVKNNASVGARQLSASRVRRAMPRPAAQPN
jgi:hypothetical protein